MSDITLGDPSHEVESSLHVCTECGRKVKKVSRDRCQTCYMRAYRAGTLEMRPALDPDIAALLLRVPGASASFAERVFAYVDATGDCWEWTGTLDDNGYGVIGRGGRGSGNMGAHCAVWSLLVGPIPKGMHYDHLCRRHSCVSPEHAEIVPPSVNKERGFSPAARYARRTKCDSGHPLDGKCRDSKSGKTIRYCKTCARNRQAAVNALKPPAPPRTHCKSGLHPWVEENIYVHPKTGRGSCKPCKADRQRAAREAFKEAA